MLCPKTFVYNRLALPCSVILTQGLKDLVSLTTVKNKHLHIKDKRPADRASRGTFCDGGSNDNI
jgi:hypothetical protein